MAAYCDSDTESFATVFECSCSSNGCDLHQIIRRRGADRTNRTTISLCRLSDYSFFACSRLRLFPLHISHKKTSKYISIYLQNEIHNVDFILFLIFGYLCGMGFVTPPRKAHRLWCRVGSKLQYLGEDPQPLSSSVCYVA